MSNHPPDSDDFCEFIEFIDGLDKAVLSRQLADAFWKGQLDDTELVRAFRCGQRGVGLGEIDVQTTKTAAGR